MVYVHRDNILSLMCRKSGVKRMKVRSACVSEVSACVSEVGACVSEVSRSGLAGQIIGNYKMLCHLLSG